MSNRSEGAQAERELALSYVPGAHRAGVAALLALDDALAALLRTTREPAIGQIRLAWWREALDRLDGAPAPAEPVLKGLEAEVLTHGVSGASLVPVVHGWEVLIEADQLDEAALLRHAEGRGRLFRAAGALVGAALGDPLDVAGQGWALADLSRNLGKAEEAATARQLATRLLQHALRRRWSRNACALGALAHLARLDLNRESPAHGAPNRVARLLWHRLTGR